MNYKNWSAESIYYNSLYNNTDSYIGIMQLYNNGAVRRYSVGTSKTEKLMTYTNKTDIYASVNNFYCYGRYSNKYTRYLNAIVIDIDYYNIPALKELEAWQVYNLIRLEKDIQEPSAVIDSGRGLYLVYFLEKTISTVKSRRLFKLVATTLVNELADYGADRKCTDVSRIIRVVGSINSKSGRSVSIIEADITKRYNLGDILSYYIGEIELFKKPRIKTKNITVDFSKYKKSSLTLNTKIADDIKLLVNMRDGDVEGLRELIIYLYALHLNKAYISPEEVCEKCLQLNDSFVKPLDRKEVVNNIKATKYNYKTQTLIELLDITEEEQQELAVLIGSEEKKDRKQERNKRYYINNKVKQIEKCKVNYRKKLHEAGKKTKAEQNAEMAILVGELMDKGLSQRKIAEELHTSAATVNRVIKQLKERRAEQAI